ncbi:hypothetical protein NE237_015054 [Protea cynaroides]|uniref:[2Fe-2S]-binding domain-containing protein n=1 Tax=Protea cynaroides TaxID=273540 RepID=A0A9Q0QQQ1_9MAGN|nr:hypothetical protein NE237_015054 [Protea cynaroides]
MEASFGWVLGLGNSSKATRVSWIQTRSKIETDSPSLCLSVYATLRLQREGFWLLGSREKGSVGPISTQKRGNLTFLCFLAEPTVSIFSLCQQPEFTFDDDVLVVGCMTMSIVLIKEIWVMRPDSRFRFVNQGAQLRMNLGRQIMNFARIYRKTKDIETLEHEQRSPEMCMSFFSALLNYEKSQRPDPHLGFSKLTVAEVEKAIFGNLCRCTGYRSIADACKSFEVDVDLEDLSLNCL